VQLQFRNHKEPSSIIVNFRTRLPQKYTNLKLKFMKNKKYHKKKTAHLYTLSLLSC